jgi:3,5-epimerase/4-reductase
MAAAASDAGSKPSAISVLVSQAARGQGFRATQAWCRKKKGSMLDHTSSLVGRRGGSARRWWPSSASWVARPSPPSLVSRTARTVPGELSRPGCTLLSIRLCREIDETKPKFVLNCAGLTGRPNVDWCEDHKDEVVRVNVIGTLSLLDLCESRGIHCTNFATGCIYKYDDEHPVGSGKGFTEEDEPNFTGSFYSLTKGMVEKLSRSYKHVLTLRFRMPISDDLNHRNFVTKITKYARVVNIPNSMTTLFDMLPIATLMINRTLTGVYNFTNPGVVTHNEILSLYRKHVDPSFWWANFTEEQCNAILKAQRSNNELDTTKLVSALPDVHVPPIQEAVSGVFERMAENLKAEGSFPPPNFKDETGVPKPEDAV